MASEKAPIDIRVLKDLKEINPLTHAGCYELVQKAIGLYGEMEAPNNLTVADLNMIISFTQIGWTFKGLKTNIDKSSLPDESKKSLNELLSSVEERYNRGEYRNIENSKGVGLVSRVGGTFAKHYTPTPDELSRFFLTLVTILSKDSSEEVCNAAMGLPQIKDVKIGTISPILHCLKPDVFPIWNGKSGNFFPRLPITPRLPKTFNNGNYINEYVEASKRLNEFRENNGIKFKNWRAVDILAYSDSSSDSKTAKNESKNAGKSSSVKTNGDLKESFRSWLIQTNGQAEQLAKRYVSYIERLHEHTTETPSVDAFRVSRLSEFDSVYKSAIAWAEKNDPDRHRYWKQSICFYRKFLNDLEQTTASTADGNIDGDTESSALSDSDKIKKLEDILDKALKECKEVPEFQSVVLPAFLRERQKIWFGAPGTGKSFKVNEFAKCLENNGGRCFRTTFHPDYDYATFVGCYKPAPAKDNAKEITYEFVPQVFTKAYVAAWKSWMSGEPKPVALVIEEINRGNCAQIFGQIFQSLDRYESGYSEYPVTMDQDLQRYLLDSEIKDSDYAKRGELVLPPNFFIFATMNTSDQSLFPMDSAFKRRWGWEYVPIDYSGDPGEWIIHINDKQQYSWKDFLISINKKILKKLKSPDKQLGERFVKADNEIIDQKTFVNKVMFYLVGDAFKDDSTIRDICKGDSDDKTEFVFADFADKDNGANNLEKFFKGLGVNPIS